MQEKKSRTTITALLRTYKFFPDGSNFNFTNCLVESLRPCTFYLINRHNVWMKYPKHSRNPENRNITFINSSISGWLTVSKS